MKKYINCVILGADKLGCVVAKEIGRFMSCFRDSNTDFNLTLCDSAVVMPSDVGELFMPEDIGWSKSAVLQQLISSNLDRHLNRDNRNFPDLSQVLRAYCLDMSEIENLTLACNGPIKGTLSKEIKADQRLIIICDCTNNESVHDACVSLMKNRDLCIHMLMLSPTDEEVSVSVKLLGNLMKPTQKWKERHFGKSDCIRSAYTMVSKMVDYISNGELRTSDVCIDDIHSDLPVSKIPKLVVCVGAGGTGGCFTKEFLPYVSEKEVSFLLIDGDYVEDKNCARQPFALQDVQQNKADTLCNAFIREFPELSDRVYSWEDYLETVEDLELAVESVGVTSETIAIVGAVDNHRARQVMHSYYESHNDVIYIDSGNEFDYGEIVVGVKENGVELTPPRAHFFPDVLTDNSPSVTELSCGTVNVSAPQHQVTNLFAGEIIMRNMESLFAESRIYSGIMYFDTFTGKHQHFPYEKE